MESINQNHDQAGLVPETVAKLIIESAGSAIELGHDPQAPTDNYRDQGNCADRHYSPDFFFPHRKQSDSLKAYRRKLANRTRQIRDICFGCPVQVDCLETSLGNGIEYGFWGGLNRRQRLGIVKWRLGRMASEEVRLKNDQDRSDRLSLIGAIELDQASLDHQAAQYLTFRSARKKNIDPNLNRQRILDYKDQNPDAKNKEIALALQMDESTVYRHLTDTSLKPTRSDKKKARQEQILDQIKANPDITQAEIAAALNSSTSTISTDIKEMGVEIMPRGEKTKQEVVAYQNQHPSASHEEIAAAVGCSISNVYKVLQFNRPQPAGSDRRSPNGSVA